MSYNYYYNLENSMYTATIYDTFNHTSIAQKNDSVRMFLDFKIIWYCFRKFPLRSTTYDTSGDDLVYVSISGRRVAKIVFDETPVFSPLGMVV